MQELIGTNAGKIYMYLHENGAVPVKTLHKSVGIEKDESERAVGWLARENKVSFETSEKGAVRITLRG